MPWRCKECGEVFGENEEASSHLEEQHPDIIDECLEEYMSDAMRDAGEQYLEEVESAEECDECGKMGEIVHCEYCETAYCDECIEEHKEKCEARHEE